MPNHLSWTRDVGIGFLIVVCAVSGAVGCRQSVTNNQAEPIPPKSEAKVTPPTDADQQVARQIKDVVLKYCHEKHETVNSNEAIAAMAAVVGERCIEAAGEIPVRSHRFVPGQRIFSDKINFLLAGDDSSNEFATIPGDSVFGTIRDQLFGSRFRPRDFPGLHEIFSGYASRIGRPEDWGKVPLSIPAKHWPQGLPLRVAFDTRGKIDAAVQSIGNDKARCLHACTLAMALILKDESLADQLSPDIALSLSFEMINGTAKSAPMTDNPIDTPTEAMRQAQHDVIKLEP